jgi:hypothetical protein
MGDSTPLGMAAEDRVAYLLAGRFALIVALVGEDRRPYATRGWSLTVLPGRPAQVRLVLGSDDGPALQEGQGSRPIALTAADPLTLRAVQFKGRAGPVELATADDQVAVARFCESFFGVVEELEGTDRRLLERMIPDDFVACTVVIDELYDQTPGPGAGAALSGGSP